MTFKKFLEACHKMDHLHVDHVPFLPVPNFGNLPNSVNSLFADSTDDDMSQDSLPHLMAFWQGIAE
jgi:hypothetical protein